MSGFAGEQKWKRTHTYIPIGHGTEEDLGGVQQQQRVNIMTTHSRVCGIESHRTAAGSERALSRTNCCSPSCSPPPSLFRPTTTKRLEILTRRKGTTGGCALSYYMSVISGTFSHFLEFSQWCVVKYRNIINPEMIFANTGLSGEGHLMTFQCRPRILGDLCA